MPVSTLQKQFVSNSLTVRENYNKMLFAEKACQVCIFVGT